MNGATSHFALTDVERERIKTVHAHATDSQGLAPLLKMLTDPSWAVRREVVRELAVAGGPAISPLCELLITGRDSETRISAAVDALAANADDVFGPVSALAAHPNPAIVTDAAQILGRRRDGRALPLLISLVRHADDNVSVGAIEALGRIGGPGGVDALIQAARSANFFRVFPALDVLGRSGDPRAIAPLAGLLNDANYMLEAARALGRTGETAAVVPLAALLTNPSESVVRVAAVALAELHHRHKERYANQKGPEEALKKANPGTPAIRRIAQSLGNSDCDEQVAISFVLGIFGGEAARASLISLLDGADVVAEAAAQALKHLAGEATQELRDALRTGASARRKVLLRSINRESATAEIILCLQDPDPMVRATACDALARTGATVAVPQLFALLADANPRVGQAAIGAIQSLGSVETKRLAFRYAASGTPVEQRAAVRILGYFGYPEALQVFTQGLSSTDLRLQDASLAGLALLDDVRALDALIAGAASPEDRTRSAAMRALGQTTRKDPRIATLLIDGLSHADPWVRYYACQSLGRLEVHTATDAVSSLLMDEAGQVRVAAVEALSHFQTEGALRALKRASEGEEPDVRRASLIGLGLSKRPEALPILILAARSTDAATRLVAISSLAESNSDQVLPALTTAAHDHDESVRIAALGFIAALANVEATGVLIALLKDSPEPERIARLLSQPADGRVAGLLAALETADDALAQSLTSALARIRTVEAKGALMKTLAHSPLAARKAAAVALGSVRSPEALFALQQAAETDRDPEVRQISALLLAQ